MKRLTLLAATIAALDLSAPAAHARFIDGFLAQCATVTSTTCGESAAAGYARQAISFSVPANGRSVNAIPFTFGSAGLGQVAGHAIYDAPTGGNLVEILPMAVPQNFVAGGLDQGDVGTLSVLYPALVPYADGAAFTGSFATGANLGSTADGSAVTTASGLSISRGILTPLASGGSAFATNAALATVAAASLPKTGGTLTGPLTGTLLYAGGGFFAGGDAANGQVQLGNPSTAGTPHIDFYGNGTTNTLTARIISDGPGQVTVQTGGGTVAFATGQVYSSLPVNTGSSMTAAGTVTGGTLAAGTRTIATGTAAPVTTTFDGVTGHAAGTPNPGSEFTNPAGATGARKYDFFGGAWIARSTP